jgi:hypothetical protein
MINNRNLNENRKKEYETIWIYITTMIFRDKKTGALLNIRRDEYVNDRLYFTEIMRVTGTGSTGTGIDGTRPLRYTQRYHELQSDHNNS